MSDNNHGMSQETPSESEKLWEKVTAEKMEQLPEKLVSDLEPTEDDKDDIPQSQVTVNVK